MALSYVLYTANGSTTQFDVTFSYIEQSHVKVYLNNVEDTSFTWVNSSRIQTSTTPANTVIVKIERTTPTASRLVDFADGSVLTESDLDKSANQNFFTVQENLDDISDCLKKDNSGVYDAGSVRIINVADATATNDAVSKNYLESTWLTTANKADLTTVAGKATEIGRLGTADAVADLAILGTTAIVEDLSILGTTAVVEDLSILGTSDVVTDMNVLGTSGNVTNMNTLSGISSNITTVAGISSNVTTVAGISANVTAVAGDATDIGTVAGKATEIGRLGTSDAVADLALLGTTAVVEDLSILGTSAVVTDMDLLGTSANVTNMSTLGASGVVANIATVAGVSANVTTVAGISSNVTTVAGISSNVTAVAGDASDIGTVATNIANVNTVAGANSNITTVAGANSNISTVAGSIANVNTVATNIAGVNSFADRYRVASSDPSSSLDAGDLSYNTSSNQVKYYNGSAWVAISADTDVKTLVSANDTTAGYLNGKLVAGSNVTFTENNDGGNETLTIASTDNSVVMAIALGA